MEIGSKINQLTLLKKLGYTTNYKRVGLFLCDCGVIKEIGISNVTSESTKGCGKNCRLKKEKYTNREHKTCTRCNELLSLDKFYKRKTSPDGIGTICKMCMNTNKSRKVQHWSGENLLCLRCKIYKPQSEFFTNSIKLHRDKKDTRCKSCRGILKEKRRISCRGNGTIEKVLLERFLGARDRAIKNGLEFNIDKEFLLGLWKRQKGFCAISKVKMTHIILSGRVPTNVSVDKINHLRGYTKDNVQLVCMAVNQMKMDLSMDDLIYFCNNIIQNNEHKDQTTEQRKIYGLREVEGKICAESC